MVQTNILDVENQEQLEEKLKEYYNLARYFMTTVSDVQGCIKEAQDTQVYIVELTELKHKLETLYMKRKITLERFMAEKRDVVRTSLANKGVSVTEKMLDDRVLRVYDKEYFDNKSKMEDSRISTETVQNLLMAMFQRKDLIKEYINFFTFSKERESCILMNKRFTEKIMKIIGSAS